MAYLGNDITNSTSEDPVEFTFNNLITQVTLELSLKIWSHPRVHISSVMFLKLIKKFLTVINFIF